MRKVMYFQLFLISYCTSLQNYFVNRGNDFLDVFNLGIEKGTYGINLTPLPVGMQYAENAKGIGLRYGNLGQYIGGGIPIIEFRTNCDVPYNDPCLYKKTCFKTYPIKSRMVWAHFGNNFLIFLRTHYHKPKVWTNRNSTKYFIDGILTGSCKGTGKTFYAEMVPKEPYSYTYFPIEFSAGLYIGFRVGFNITELFDFLLGLTTIDFMEDDVGIEKNLTEPGPIDYLDKYLDPFEVNQILGQLTPGAGKTESQQFIAKQSLKYKNNIPIECIGFQVCHSFFYNPLIDNYGKFEKCLYLNEKTNCSKLPSVGKCSIKTENIIYYRADFWNDEQARIDCITWNGKYTK